MSRTADATRIRYTTWPLPRPLPRRVQPFPDETAGSYLDRVADANLMDTRDLRIYLARGKRALSAPLDVPALAVLAGVAERALRHAIPELSSPTELAGLGSVLGRPRPHYAATGEPCRPCTAIRCGTQRVTRWQTHESVICLRHRLWADAGGSGTGTQLDLRDQPEIIAASRLHRRLIRRYGRPAVHAAFRDAREICHGWHHDYGVRLAGVNERLSALSGDPEGVRAGDPAVAAAFYPHAVALARLLASPYWKELVLGEHHSPRISLGDSVLDGINKEIRSRHPGADVNFEWQELQLMRERMHLRDKPGTWQFAAEVRRSVAPGYAWLPLSHYNHMEPLAEWVRDRIIARDTPQEARWRPPASEVYLSEHLSGDPGWPQYAYRRGRKPSTSAGHLEYAGTP